MCDNCIGTNDNPKVNIENVKLELGENIPTIIKESVKSGKGFEKMKEVCTKAWTKENPVVAKHLVMIIELLMVLKYGIANNDFNFDETIKAIFFLILDGENMTEEDKIKYNVSQVMPTSSEFNMHRVLESMLVWILGLMKPKVENEYIKNEKYANELYELFQTMKTDMKQAEDDEKTRKLEEMEKIKNGEKVVKILRKPKVYTDVAINFLKELKK
jgi:hypothetical protein